MLYESSCYLKWQNGSRVGKMYLSISLINLIKWASWVQGVKGALSHFRILFSNLLIILNNLQVIQVLAAK